jgi:HK97 family phage portal protein
VALLKSLFGIKDDEVRSLRPVEIPILSTDAPLSVSPVLDADQYNVLGISDAYACVNALASDVASLPVSVFRNTPAGRQEVGPDARISQLLARPIPGSTSCDLFSSLMVHLLVCGNAFLGKFRGADDEIVQLGLLDPNSVWVELRGQQIVYTVYLSSQDTTTFGPRDILHIKAMTGLPPNDLRGLSPVTQARVALTLNSNLQESARQYFANGSRPSGILQVAGPQSDYTIEQVREQWSGRHTGTENMHRIAVLSGEAKFTPVSFSADDSQFLGTREMSAREIARIFGIPAWRIDAEQTSHRTYANITQQNLFYVQHSLRVWLTRIERAFTGDPDLCVGGQCLEFDLDGLLRGDPDLRTTLYQRALGSTSSGQPGWLTVDEVRAAEGLEPLAVEQAETPAIEQAEATTEEAS